LTLRARILAREELRGVIVKAPSPDVVELAALAGVDFVVADGEHGPIGPETCLAMARAAEARGTPALVRVPSHDPPTVLRFLETGVAGLHVPSVSGPEILRDALDAIFHPPLGRRGLAGGRWASWGVGGVLVEFIAAVAEELVVVAHVEDRAGLSALDALLEEPRVDVFYLGPVDLSSDLGFPGEVDRAEVQDACADAVRRIAAAGRAAGIVIRRPEELEHWREQGATYLVGNAESLMAAGVRRFVTEAKTVTVQ
jgi:4-hydroxy-2-oxoheptanedioate aldolase